MTITLEAKKRAAEKPEAVRTGGMVPAVYYGFKKETTSIMVPAVQFSKVYKEAGETTTVTLDFGDQKVSALIHDVQFDPITNNPIHADFLVVDMNKEIEVPVPLEFIGISEAEKGGLGTLMKVLHEVQVRALPANMPHNIEVDISALKTLEDQIHVRDLTVGDKVTIVTGEDEVIALVAPFVEEKEEAPAAIDLDSIEVVGKKEKAEEEDQPTE